MENKAPKKIKERIKELDNELLKIAKILSKKDPYVLEYLVNSVGNVIPQLRHLLREVKAGSSIKS